MIAHRSVALAGQALGSHDHHLAGFDVVQIDGVDQVERAGFRREHVAGAAAGHFHLAERERPETMRIARDQDAVLRQKHQRKSAFQLQQRFAQRGGQSLLARPGDQVQDHFGIAVGLKDGSFAFQFPAQFGGVGDVAVVRHRDAALVAVHREGLRVEHPAIAGGGVARVADGHFAGQPAQHFRSEQIRDVAHAAMGVDHAAIARGDPGAFLSAMLQRVETQVGQIRGLGMPVDREDAALFMELVEH